MNKPIYFELDVTTQGQEVSKTFNLERDVTAINGFQIDSDRLDVAVNRLSIGLEIDNKTRIHRHIPAKLFISNVGIKPSERYTNFGSDEVGAIVALPVGNGQISLSAKDVDSGLTAFTPYKVRLILNVNYAY